VNLLLLFPEDFEHEGRAVVRGRRARHVSRILRASEGDSLCVGLVGERIGSATIVSLDARELVLDVRLEREPPPPLAATLVLALPRPPVLGRVLAAATSFGVKRIVLLHTRRVEKTYWDASALAPDALQEKLVLGLEQARDTTLPELLLRRRFRPFVEDELASWVEHARGVFAHPEPAGDDAGGPIELPTPAVVAVGPEGGFLDREVEQLRAAGMRPVSLGPRALRVETAVAALLGRLVR
jgi:RsmE family RNA methyltransferase